MGNQAPASVEEAWADNLLAADNSLQAEVVPDQLMEEDSSVFCCPQTSVRRGGLQRSHDSDEVRLACW